MKTTRNRLPTLLALLLASTSLGCAAIAELFRDPQDTVAPMTRPDRLYEALVDHYVELCAVSQYRPLEGDLGGIPGHAVMYLKGACRDESAPYPRLRPCRYATFERDDPEHGAGVSVNRWFKNVNWVATPGKFLFFDGEVADYALLDRARFDATLQRALDLEMYRGVELHTKPDADAPQSIREFVAQDSIRTDFALRFGRTVFCTRIPMPDELLTRAMDYLNALNDEYWNGEADYNWSGYADNCVHTLHNALAAAGVWKPKSIRATKLRQLFNLAVPANTFIDLAFLSNRYPIEDFDKVRRDDLHWQGLVTSGWVPAAPGALVKMSPVLQVNALYDTKYRMFVLGGWFSNDTLKRAQHLLNDGRYLQLDANLRYFYDRYERILAERDAAGGGTGFLRGDDYREDRETYYAYIEEQRNGVVAVMKRLGELDALREEILDEARETWKVRVPEVPGDE
jgi:hypothetical protein